MAALARTAPSERIQSALEALDAFEHSLRLRPSQPASFNTAIAMERLGLRSGAIAAWQRYLDNDSRSGWAGEAAERLDLLERAAPEGGLVAALMAQPATEISAFGRNAWADRQWGERTLLARWAERELAGDRAGAEAALGEVDTITHFADDPLRAAADRISSEIAAAMSGAAGGEVIPFQPAGGEPRRRGARSPAGPRGDSTKES